MIPVQPRQVPFNEVTKYDNVTTEQWAELKSLLHKEFRLPMQQNQAKIQWGSSTYEWDTGILEWDFHQNDQPDSKKADRGEFTYYLEIRIRRRPADPEVLAVEATIAAYFKRVTDKQKRKES
jgi:hypothetical protein